MYHTNNPVWRNLFPTDARREDSPYSNNRLTDPIFGWNVTYWNFGIDNFVFQHNEPTFRTDLIISPLYDYTQHSVEHSHASLFYYPFDRYCALIACVIRLTIFTDVSVTVPKYSLLPKTHQRMNQSPWSFIPQSDSLCKLPSHLSFIQLTRPLSVASKSQPK